MTREEAVEDLQAHPCSRWKITLFHPESSNLELAPRHHRLLRQGSGELSQEDVANLNAFGFLNDSFLKGLQQ